MSRLFLWLPLVAGCINIKPFNGGDGGPPPNCTGTGGRSTGLNYNVSIGAVAVSTASGGATVTTPNYAMQFSTSGAHLPDSLVPSGFSENLFGTSTSCNDPSGMSLEVAPGNSTADATRATGTITVLEDGPSIGRIVIQYTLPLVCGSISGTSTWTFFPDGRVTRHETVSGTTGAGPCVCGSAATSHDFFMSTLFDHIIAIVDPRLMNYTADTTPKSIADELCLTTGTNGVLAIDGPGPQGTLVQANSLPALRYHFQAGEMPTTDDAVQTLVVTPGATQCGGILAAGAGYETYVHLHAGADEVDITDNHDGIVGTYTTGISVPDEVDFTVPTGSQAPAGYAIGLNFQGPRHTFEVTRNGVDLSMDEAQVQPVKNAPAHAVLWLRDSFGGDNAPCDVVHLKASEP